ncbi:hypothetical protein [Streptomyces sp. DH24]|uniref:hypothetical protein n=1 Tax=Streptomyces sp. DH24 TaxID=3040123 RepID=UPI0024413AD1|nr:hypothetical protein [Streptomyces sp. DH24]MDG9718903.1 hypothetical protein [Streptomyces sp. DH24]
MTNTPQLCTTVVRVDLGLLLYVRGEVIDERARLHQQLWVRWNGAGPARDAQGDAMWKAMPGVGDDSVCGVLQARPDGSEGHAASRRAEPYFFRFEDGLVEERHKGHRFRVRAEGQLMCPVGCLKVSPVFDDALKPANLLAYDCLVGFELVDEALQSAFYVAAVADGPVDSIGAVWERASEIGQGSVGHGREFPALSECVPLVSACLAQRRVLVLGYAPAQVL